MDGYPEYYQDLAVLDLPIDPDEPPPSLTDISAKFKHLVLHRHPDKPGGTHESFLKLYAAYKRLGVYISKLSDTAWISKEEAELCAYFKQFNSEETKSRSTVVLIEDFLVKAWEKILTREYGNPKVIYANKVPTGKKWDIENYISGKAVYITKYDEPKSDGRSKLHVQGNVHLFFTAKQLPAIYDKVCKLHNEDNNDPATPVIGMNISAPVTPIKTEDKSAPVTPLKSQAEIPAAAEPLSKEQGLPSTSPKKDQPMAEIPAAEPLSKEQGLPSTAPKKDQPMAEIPAEESLSKVLRLSSPKRHALPNNDLQQPDKLKKLATKATKVTNIGADTFRDNKVTNLPCKNLLMSRSDNSTAMPAKIAVTMQQSKKIRTRKIVSLVPIKTLDPQIINGPIKDPQNKCHTIKKYVATTLPSKVKTLKHLAVYAIISPSIFQLSEPKHMSQVTLFPKFKKSTQKSSTPVESSDDLDVTIGSHYSSLFAVSLENTSHKENDATESSQQPLSWDDNMYDSYIYSNVIRKLASIENDQLYSDQKINKRLKAMEKSQYKVARNQISTENILKRMLYSIENIEDQVSKIQQKLQVKEIVDRDMSHMTEDKLNEIKTAVIQAECMQGKITDNCLAAIKESSIKFKYLDKKLDSLEENGKSQNYIFEEIKENLNDVNLSYRKSETFHEKEKEENKSTLTNLSKTLLELKETLDIKSNVLSPIKTDKSMAEKIKITEESKSEQIKSVSEKKNILIVSTNIGLNADFHFIAKSTGATLRTEKADTIEYDKKAKNPELNLAFVTQNKLKEEPAD